VLMTPTAPLTTTLCMEEGLNGYPKHTPRASGAHRSRRFQDRPTSSHRFDTVIRRLGVRVTAIGSKSWVLNYVNASGHERLMVLGSTAVWDVRAIRKRAAALRREIDQDRRPARTKAAERSAVDMNDLFDAYLEQAKKSKRSYSEQGRPIRNRTRHLLGENLLALCSGQRVALQGKIPRSGTEAQVDPQPGGRYLVV
jgi:hypothetical protein